MLTYLCKKFSPTTEIF